MSISVRCCADLLHAVEDECIECVKTFSDDPEQQSLTGRSKRTALHLAIKKPLILEHLLPKMRSHINDQDFNGKTPLQCLLSTKPNETLLEKVKLLISRGADVNIKDNQEVNALFIAARESNLSIFEYLRSLNAESIKDVDGYNILFICASRNYDIELFKYILENRVSLNVDPINDDTNNNIGLLHLLCYAKDGLEKMKCLSQVSDLWHQFICKNINKKDNLGRTPLMWLMSKSYNSNPEDKVKDIEFLKMLLSLNADPLIKYNDCVSCIEQAKVFKLDGFVEIMTNYQDLPL